MNNQTYSITVKQWQEVNAALNVAVSAFLEFKPELYKQMLSASKTMDDVVNAHLSGGAA